ncbi:MAG: 2-hydroxyglutaryl-CoA dehydratase [Myxococcales bacterium]|nr:2-hydroxyglutaryl-CoA dehydratase [Myxococcales bacterium]
METISSGTKKLPILNNKMELDVDAELKAFELEQMAQLGLEAGKEHWRDDNPTTFMASQRAHTTVLISGLTMAHDFFLQGALRGIGYKVQAIDCPDNAALQIGKEFGNRGQCNPTYFTVGNLVKYLTYLRDEKKIPVQEIVSSYVFVTAGACGPCRFGTYVTEYRKALRDSGFDGFRVLLFQQQGGLKQATGEAQGLEMVPKFFIALLKAILIGDVMNALSYRIRPYEVVKGATDEAITKSKQLIHDAFAEPGKKSLLWAMIQTRRNLMNVKVDRTIVKPKVSIIGEFWAMTTEGDGNYGLQRFLEQEGAECDVQLVTAWILFMIWEQRWDTKQRMVLRGEDTARKGLAGKNATKKLAMLWVAEKAIRGVFATCANIMGLHDYPLPDMDKVAETASPFYNNHLRGGEGHMEVGKLILNVKFKKATMTLSVKPFGCMPSSGVSDGVQSLVTERYPEAIYCPIETNGDGAVNVYSRVQMMLFKARLAAKDEYQKTLETAGLTADELKLQLQKNWWKRSALYYPKHGTVAAMSSNVVQEVTGVGAAAH